MTTSDQKKEMLDGEGNDSICWSEEPLTMTFASEKDLQDFCSAVSKLLQKLLHEHMYNSVTSLLIFYREYKEGQTPMPEYFHDHYVVHYPQSPCCVGNALLTMEALLDPHEYFVKKYPHLERYLYYVSSNITGYTWLESIPEQYKMQPPIETALYVQHVMIALRFTLDGRVGFILIDLGYNFFLPIVVMADGESPHTEPFLMSWFKDPIQQSFRLEGNYVHWIETELSVSPEPPSNRWVFVAKKFNKLREAEKRNRVTGFHAMVCRGSSAPKAGIMCIFGKDDGVTVSCKDEDGKVLREVVPFDYLTSSDNGAENKAFESAIAVCSQGMGVDENDLRSVMRQLAEIVADKIFFDEFLKLNDYYTTFVERFWKGIE